MKSLGGGTEMYCPKCEVIRECRVPTDLGMENQEIIISVALQESLISDEIENASHALRYLRLTK